MHSPSVRITILVDNAASDNLLSEHGFALWIEAENIRILLDTGQGPMLMHNAQLLGINLAETNILVLSHGHYDHTGGIPQVLEQAPDTHVYAHPDALLSRFSLRDAVPHDIQMPRPSIDAIEIMPAHNLHWITQPVMLSPALGITGFIPRVTSYEDTGGPFFYDRQGLRPDPIHDDMSLWFRTNQGLVICTGCCHSGLVNTIEHIQAVTGEHRIHAIIGGFHLLNATSQRIDPTIDALRAINPAIIVPCHCTGDEPVRQLETAFPGCVQPGYAGMILSF